MCVYDWEHQHGSTNVGDTCRCATVNVLTSEKSSRQCHVLVVYDGDGKEEEEERKHNLLP